MQTFDLLDLHVIRKLQIGTIVVLTLLGGRRSRQATNFALDRRQVIDDAGQPVTHLVLTVHDFVVKLLDRLHEVVADRIELIRHLIAEVTQLVGHCLDVTFHSKMKR